MLCELIATGAAVVCPEEKGCVGGGFLRNKFDKALLTAATLKAVLRIFTSVFIYGRRCGMEDEARFTRELPLLPDSELIRLAREVRNQTRQRERLGDRAGIRQDIDQRIQALEEEIEARGIVGPPGGRKCVGAAIPSEQVA